MINWHIVSSEQYHAGSPVATSMYFLTDTHEIYRGTELFSQAVTLFDKSAGMPAAPAYNRLYIDKATLEGWMFDGEVEPKEWAQVIKGVDNAVTANGANAVSGAAVATYVAAELAKLNAGVVDITWDASNRALDVTKAGQDAPESLVLSGLVNAMRFDNSTGELFLVDDQGADIGTGVNLGLHQFVRSGEVLDEDGTKYIVLYFDEEKANFVKFAATDLIDVYTAEGSATLDLSVTGHTISGAVKVSAEAGNLITAKDDGLYVAPIDLSGKMDKVPEAAPDTIAIFDENGNVVSAGKALDELAANTNVYVGTPDQAREDILAGKTIAKGDILIEVKTLAEGKMSHTAYIAVPAAEGTDTFVWQAMSGNYSAKDVYFSEDLQTTSAIGNITLTNGQATIAAAGRNLVDVFKTIFVKAKNPSVTQPSVSLTFSQAKAYEVGTNVTPSYTANLSIGSYQYGPATGVAAESYTITAANKGTTVATKDTNTGSFEAIVVEDDTRYTIKAEIAHGAGVAPVNNLGDEVPSLAIAAGTKSKTHGTAITGYRNGFWGTLTSKAGELNSDLVRNLANKSNGAMAVAMKFNISIPIGALRVVFAYPATLPAVTSVIDINGMNAEIRGSFTEYSVQVEGANNFAATTYRVYVMDRAAAATDTNTYAVTL